MPSDLTQREWWIGLDAWVLQDGNYTDFAVGQVRQFALEFGYPRHSRMTLSDGPLVCETIDEDESYWVTADLIRSASQPMENECFVIDFGLLAYTNWMVLDDLNPPRAGSRLTGQVSIAVDPFEYMDHFSRQPNMPALIYTWRIEEIRLDTSPGMRVEFGHPLYVGPDEGPMMVRDPSRRSWRDIAKTETWNDQGSYNLRCRLLDAEPARSMERSGKRSPYGPLIG